MRDLNIECNDIIILKVSDKVYRSRVSKVDGNVVKLFEENGTYRQMPINNLEKLIKDGFASIEKHTAK